MIQSKIDMGKIKKLPPLISERIAAGEVIERPASVVKELVENSIDAQASEVRVELEDGGKAKIKVIDNGTGMEKDDLEISIQRHATSKLREVSDLDRIATLGFRGEALPSIAAVSEFKIRSKTKENNETHQLTIHSITGSSSLEKVTHGHFLNENHGTQMEVTGLFSQIPARLKFLKSKSAEVTQVRDWIERLALSHPDRRFQLFSDQKVITDLAVWGEDRIDQEAHRVQTVLSGGNDFPIITLESHSKDLPGFSLRVHWLQGLSVGHARKVVQIVNGRVLKDKTLQAAVMHAFRQALLPGQFPALALYMDLPPSEIDVNVHPTKTEVRFLQSSLIFREVRKLCEQMIIDYGVTPTVAPKKDQASFKSNPPTQLKRTVLPKSEVFQFQPAWSSPSEELKVLQEVNETHPDPQDLVQNKPIHPFGEAQYKGIFFSTYLVFENSEEIILIDQHAAHERVRYEQLKNKAIDTKNEIQSQALLIPEAIKFNLEQKEELHQKLSLLSQMGFEVEFFGEETLLFRSIPPHWGSQDLRTRLKNLIDRLIEMEIETNDSPQLDHQLFEKLASEACHSAIRAGDRLEPEEAKSLVKDLFQCEHPWNCPHGRPTTVRLPSLKFEEWFQRKI